MAPIAVASLAMLVGLFTILATRNTDRRLCLAGLRSGTLLAVRLTTIGSAVLVAVVVALLVTASVFQPANWPVYAVGNLVVATTYALVGVLVGPLFGRVSGVFLAFLVPFLDVGISQSPMLSAQPDQWAHWLPGYGGTRLVLDGALTSGFDETMPLVSALAWLLGLATVTALVAPVELRGPDAAPSGFPGGSSSLSLPLSTSVCCRGVPLQLGHRVAVYRCPGR
jgi:hypothetical protein